MPGLCSFLVLALLQSVSNASLTYVLRQMPHALRQMPYAPAVHMPNKTGGTLDQCREQDHCSARHKCLDISTFPNPPLCTGSAACRCLPPLLTRCATSASCPPGEVCARWFRENQYAYCFSAAFEEQSLNFNEVPDGAPVPKPTPPVQGLTFDICQSQSQCRGARTCSSDIGMPCADEDGCLCLPPTFRLCTSSAPGQCPNGEVCATYQLSIPPITACFSKSAVDSTPQFILSKLRPAQPPLPMDAGYTLDSCNVQTQCRLGRTCTLIPVQERNPCADLIIAVCKCYPNTVTPCSNDSDCTRYEACRTEATSKKKICMSIRALRNQPSLAAGGETNASSTAPSPTNDIPAPSPTNDIPAPSREPKASGPHNSPGPSPGAESPSASIVPTQTITPGDQSPGAVQVGATPTPTTAVCIDARALGHLKPAEKVFDRDMPAKVLCDASGSCATPGHMVLFRGEAMMMKRFCAKIGCVERVLRVNSPRYRRKLTVASKTGGLVYTSFAARYESKAEEAALQIAIRAGF